MKLKSNLKTQNIIKPDFSGSGCFHPNIPALKMFIKKLLIIHHLDSPVNALGCVLYIESMYGSQELILMYISGLINNIYN
jgi:hypothetical protein